jgi:MerR family transcriptional regulator, copper efflux regulator
MKIKDVAKLTGLTEKTIRFYEDKGLITPDKEEISGRMFRSYSDETVVHLNLVASLRKLDFSISDIIIMRDNPEKISTILREYYSTTLDDLDNKTKVIQLLEQVKYDNINSLEELAEQLSEISKNRPLPVADIELEFYKVDSISKEELQEEVSKYKSRLSLKFKRKIRSTIIFFTAAILLFIVLAAFIWRTTYYLGYSISFPNDIDWRKFLIPFFGLLLYGFIFTFVKTLEFIDSLKVEDTALLALRICRYSIFVLALSFIVGIGISAQSIKSMKDMREDIGREVVTEWYPIYRMINTVDKYLSNPEVYGEAMGNRFYVNEVCYSFSKGYGDILNTKMYELLIFGYDTAFNELVNPQSNVNKEEIAKILKELNSQLRQIYINIANKSEIERAGLTRKDLPEAVEFRKHINNIIDEYFKKLESLMGRQRP